MWQLIRFALWRWCGWRRQQQGLVKTIAKTERGLDISAEVRDDDLLVQNGAVLANPSAIGCQSEVDDAVRKTKCRSPFIKNERCMGNVANRDYGYLRGRASGLSAMMAPINSGSGAAKGTALLLYRFRQRAFGSPQTLLAF